MAVLGAAAIAASVSIPAFARQEEETRPLAAASTEGAEQGTTVIDGEPGDIVVVGDLVFEIVTPEEVEKMVSGPAARASKSKWSIELSGTSMSQRTDVTAEYPYMKVWIKNDGKRGIQFTITKGSETGTVVENSDVTIAAGVSTSIYSKNAWPADKYYSNFTCGKTGLSGAASCRIASTKGELDI